MLKALFRGTQVGAARAKRWSCDGSTLATRHFSSLRTSLAAFSRTSLEEYKVLRMMALVRQTQKRRFLRHSWTRACEFVSFPDPSFYTKGLGTRKPEDCGPVETGPTVPVATALS